MTTTNTKILVPYHQTGHSKAVSVIANTPSYIITGGNDGKVIIWDKQLNEEACIYAHKSTVANIVFIPEINIIVTTSIGSSFKLWSLDDFSLITEYPAHSARISQIFYINKKLFSLAKDHILKVWDISSQGLIKTDQIKLPEVHRFFILGGFIIFSFNSGDTQVYDIKNLKRRGVIFINMNKTANALKQSLKDSLIAIDKNIHAVLNTIYREYGIVSSKSAECDNFFIIGHHFGLVSFWKKRDFSFAGVYAYHTSYINGLLVSNTTLFSCSLDSTIVKVDLSSKKKLVLKKITLSSRPTSIELIDDKELLIGTETGELLIFDLDLNQVNSFGSILGIGSVTFGDDALFVGYSNGNVGKINYITFKRTHFESHHTREVLLLHFYEGKLFSVGADRRLLILDNTLSIIKTIDIPFMPQSPSAYGRYIKLSDIFIFDTKKEEIMKGQVSSLTLTDSKESEIHSFKLAQGDLIIEIDEYKLRNMSLEKEIRHSAVILPAIRLILETLLEKEFKLESNILVKRN